MWFLRSKCGLEYILLPGKTFKVGRKDCHIVILEDQSISRCHAELVVSSNDTNRDKTTSSVSLRDLSKFGTLVNGCKLEKNSEVSLKSGDEIKFGSTQSSKVFEVQFAPFTVCCSGMKTSEQRKVCEMVGRYGGTVVPTWTKQCVALIMNKLTVTQKVISALASCRPVVTVQWLVDLVDHPSITKPLPDHKSYLPPIVDRNLDNGPSDFHVNLSRRELFTGKRFHFLSKQQIKLYELCITMCGGECLVLSATSHQVDQLSIDGSRLVVGLEDREVEKLPQSEREWVHQVYEHVKRSGYREIHDTEIVRAVLHCSTTVYCNPTSQPVSFGSPLPQPSLSQPNASQNQPRPRQTPIGEPVMSSTQLQSQISLLEGRRCSSSNLSSVSLNSQDEDNSFKMPSTNNPSIALRQEREITSTPTAVGASLEAPIPSTLEQRESVLAPNSLPAGNSLESVGKVSSASFVAGLFPPKRKRPVSEATTSNDNVEPSLKKTPMPEDWQQAKQKPPQKEATEHLGSCSDLNDHNRNASALPPSTPCVDKASSSGEGVCGDVPTSHMQTRRSSDAVLPSRGEYNSSRTDQITNLSSSRRPRRFIESPCQPSPRDFISTRKTSKSFYHPPVTVDSEVSKILMCSKVKDEIDRTVVSQNDGSTVSTLEYIGGDHMEVGDRSEYSVPAVKCPFVSLLRKKPDCDSVSGQLSSSTRNFKRFKKVQPLGESMVNRTIITGQHMQCYQKHTSSTLFTDEMESQVESNDRENSIGEEATQEQPDSNPFRFVSKLKSLKKK